MRIVQAVAAAALYTGFSLLLFAPPGAWPGLTFLGAGGDPLQFIWYLHWWPFALLHHLNPLFCAYVDAPAGTDLLWKTAIPTLALLAAPFAFGDDVAAYNVLMMAAPAAAAFTAYLAARGLSAGFVAALLGGTVFGFSSYEMSQVAGGHLNLCFTALLPLTLLAVVRLDAARLAGAFGVLLALEFGISQEIFATALLFGALFGAAVYGLHPELRPALRGKVRGLAGGLVICVILVSPLLVPMLETYRRNKGDLPNPMQYSHDLLGFFVPTPVTLWGQRLEWFTVRFTGNFGEQGAWFGLLLPAVALAAWRRPAGAVLFAASCIASLGPRLWVDGAQTGHRLPWYVATHLPLLGGILPNRLILFAWLAGAILLALWMTKWWRIGLVLLGLLTILPGRALDARWTHVDVPPVFATLPAGAHILILPIYGNEIGFQYESGMRFYLTAQGYLSSARPAPFRNWPGYEKLFDTVYGAVDPAQFAAFLKQYGVEDVVVLPDGYDSLGPSFPNAPAHAAALKLMRATGWRERADELFTPPPPPRP
jgi:hypothetical protein